MRLHPFFSNLSSLSQLLKITVLMSVLVSAAGGCTENKQTGTYQGYVEGEFVNISPAVSGQLEQLLVRRGQDIEQSTPLFILESGNETAAQRQAEKQLISAEAQLRNLLSGQRPQELEVIKAQLDQALAQAKISSAELKREQVLYKGNAISPSQFEQTQAEANRDSARVAELRNQLTVAALPGREEQINALTADVEAARAGVDQASWKLNQKTVASPVSGLVFDTLYRTGEWVKEGTPVVRILPPENVKVRFFVPETKLGELSIGRSCAIHCDGCPAEIPGKITYISTQAEYTPPIIYSTETRSKLVFMAEAHPEPEAQASNLHPGQPVGVRLK